MLWVSAKWLKQNQALEMLVDTNNGNITLIHNYRFNRHDGGDRICPVP